MLREGGEARGVQGLSVAGWWHAQAWPGLLVCRRCRCCASLAARCLWCAARVAGTARLLPSSRLPVSLRGGNRPAAMAPPRKRWSSDQHAAHISAHTKMINIPPHCAQEQVNIPQAKLKVGLLKARKAQSTGMARSRCWRTPPRSTTPWRASHQVCCEVLAGASTVTRWAPNSLPLIL